MKRIVCECSNAFFLNSFRGNRKSQSEYPNHFVESVFWCVGVGCPLNTANYWNEQVDIYIVYYRSFRFGSHDAAAAITIIRLIDAMIRLKCKWLWDRLGVEIETRKYEYSRRSLISVDTSPIDENFVRSIFSFSPFPHKKIQRRKNRKDSIAICCMKHGNVNEDKTNTTNSTNDAKR